MNLETLLALGFSASEQSDEAGYLHPKCYACSALVINGTPCHETGCPDAMHECNGCNELIPARQRYCENCQ